VRRGPMKLANPRNLEFSLTVHHLAHVTDRPRPAVRAGGIMGATINHSCRLDRSGNDGTNGCSWLI
jgi:hypothetical protein